MQGTPNAAGGQTALVIIKPDAIGRKIAPKILDMLVMGGFSIREQALTRLTRAEAEALYEDLLDKPWGPPQIDFMVSGPVLVLEVGDEGDPAGLTARLRKLIGATQPKDREPGTIRYAFGDPETPRYNCIHGSDSAESAARELALLRPKFGRRSA